MAIIRASEGYAKMVFGIKQCAGSRGREYVPRLASKMGRSSIVDRDLFTPTGGKHTRLLFIPIGVGIDIHGSSISDDVFQKLVI